MMKGCAFGQDGSAYILSSKMKIKSFITKYHIDQDGDQVKLVANTVTEVHITGLTCMRISDLGEMAFGGSDGFVKIYSENMV